MDTPSLKLQYLALQEPTLKITVDSREHSAVSTLLSYLGWRARDYREDLQDGKAGTRRNSRLGHRSHRIEDGVRKSLLKGRAIRR